MGVPNVSLPPMIAWDRDNNPTGFEIDFIAETAYRFGVSYEIIPIDPGTEREKLEDGNRLRIWHNGVSSELSRKWFGQDYYIK